MEDREARGRSEARERLAGWLLKVSGRGRAAGVRHWAAAGGDASPPSRRRRGLQVPRGRAASYLRKGGAGGVERLGRAAAAAALG